MYELRSLCPVLEITGWFDLKIKKLNTLVAPTLATFKFVHPEKTARYVFLDQT